MSFVYPHETLHDLLMCLKWSILCPTNAQVNYYNDTLLECVEGIPCIYHAADSLKDIEETRLTPPESVLDYDAQHSSPGFPCSKLLIKTGGVYHVMCNMFLDHGLVKNVRVVVIAVGSRLIMVHLLKGVGSVSTVSAEDIL